MAAQFDAALANIAAQKLNQFRLGVTRYWAAPALPPAPPVPVFKNLSHNDPAYGDKFGARLLDYRPAKKPKTRGLIGKKPILIVPSLVNRAYILDIGAGQSFLRHLGKRLGDQGYAPFLLDWGEPGAVEREYDLEDYIKIPLGDAAQCLHDWAGGDGTTNLTVIGYCMGGVLALALALRQPYWVRNLVLLATPWDFHADEILRQRVMPTIAWLKFALARWLQAGEALPVDIIQSLFFALDPMLSLRKFDALAHEADESKLAKFAQIEDWVNDGIPLAGLVARECLSDWYGGNILAQSTWRIDGQVIAPSEFPNDWGGRCLAVIPAKDRIVPPASALALAKKLPNCTIMRPNLGHVAMMTAAHASKLIWDDIADWIAAGG